MEITIDVLENFNKENNTKYTTEEWEKKYSNIVMDLPIVQDKIKRQNNLYNDDFKVIMSFFKVKFNMFIENPSKKIHGMKDFFNFFAHVGFIYPKEVSFIPSKLINLIENNFTVINPEIRLGIVESLSILRKKNLLDCLEILPLFFKLLRCQDKILRRKIHEMIITDLTRLNQNHKNNAVNKKLQNFCQENMLSDPNKKAARKTLNIMITLYKKKVWNDTKAVNSIGSCCYSSDPKICYAASQFFLTEYEEAENDSSEEEELDELKNKYKLLGKANSRKTKARKAKLKNLMKSIDRREKRKSKVKVNKDFMPIDLLNDPTNFAERLFQKLKSLRENFKLKLALMRLIGRVLGRHKLFIENFYAFMLNFLNPNQNELAVIFASLIESLHDMIPPVELEPIISKLFDSFISEANPPGYITIGVNALREICERSPYVMTKERLNIIKCIKELKDKSVSNAARSLLNLYKEFNLNMEDLYEKNDVGIGSFGQVKASDRIEGIELLRKHENLPEDYKMEYETILDDIQLKKLKILKMKYNAEKIQHKNTGMSKSDINQMAGEKGEKKEKKKLNKTYEEDNEESDEGEELNESDLENLDSDQSEGDLEDNDGEESEMEELEDFEGEELEDDEELEDNEFNGSVEDLELNEEKSGDEFEILSEELKSNESDEDEERNVHGFVDPNNLLTYKKRYREKIEELRNQQKEKYEHRRKEKAGGKTNKEKLKNKPLMMVLAKKKFNTKIKDEGLNKKIKKMKQQLGRYKRGNMVLQKKGGITSKKKKR